MNLKINNTIIQNYTIYTHHVHLHVYNMFTIYIVHNTYDCIYKYRLLVCHMPQLWHTVDSTYYCLEHKLQWEMQIEFRQLHFLCTWETQARPFSFTAPIAFSSSTKSDQCCGTKRVWLARQGRAYRFKFRISWRKAFDARLPLECDLLFLNSCAPMASLLTLAVQIARTKRLWQTSLGLPLGYSASIVIEWSDSVKY